METEKLFCVILSVFIGLFLLSTTSFALTYVHSPWYDVNKYSRSGEPIPPGVEPGPTPETSDSLMCWAAAASNVLMYTGWGFDRDSDGIIERYDDLYHFFLSEFPNSAGSGSGAYRSYVPEYWGSVLSTNGEDWYDYFVQWNPDNTIFPKVADYLGNDYGIYLSITNDAGTLGHAITAWGYEQDDTTSEYTRIAVTDSDRQVGINSQTLQWYNISYSNNRWYIDDYGTGVYIRRIDAYMQNPYAQVPEPPTLLLLGAGLISIGMVCRKRMQR